MAGIAKAIAAAVAPWVLIAAHAAGFTEVTTTGAEVAIVSALSFVLTWAIPNRAK